jgi:hypothetical protein
MSDQERTAMELSPDGQWRWDGTRWLPVAPRPAGTASDGRSARTAILVLAAAGALLVGAVAGSIAAGLGRADRPLAGAPTAFPATFPSGGDRYLRDQTVTGLEQAATSANYTCSQQSHGAGSWYKQAIDCEFNGDTPTFPSMDIYADGQSQVVEVTMSCRRPFGATKSACGTIEGSLARQMFPRGSPLGSQAQAWVAQNVGNGTATIIGSVYLFTRPVNADDLNLECLPAGGTGE